MTDPDSAGNKTHSPWNRGRVRYARGRGGNSPLVQQPLSQPGPPRSQVSFPQLLLVQAPSVPQARPSGIALQPAATTMNVWNRHQGSTTPQITSPQTPGQEQRLPLARPQTPVQGQEPRSLQPRPQTPVKGQEQCLPRPQTPSTAASSATSNVWAKRQELFAAKNVTTETSVKSPTSPKSAPRGLPPHKGAHQATTPVGAKKVPWGKPEQPAVPKQVSLTVSLPSIPPQVGSHTSHIATSSSSKPVLPTGESPRTQIAQLVQKVGDMAVEKAPIKSTRPLRIKETGKIEGCSSLSVRANHFGVNITKNFPEFIYHYNVEISPGDNGTGSGNSAGSEGATLPDRILPYIWREFQRQHEKLLKASTPFDGKKNCYSAKRIEFEHQDGFNTTLKMDDPDDPDKKRQFQVKMNLVKILPTQAFWQFLQSGESGLHVDLPQDIIQALDVALRVAPAIQYFACNRSFFSNKNPMPLDRRPGLLELWSGHYQSLCLGSDSTPTLNIDLATKAFYKEMPVTEFLRRNLGLAPTDSMDLQAWDDHYLERATECLKGKLIKYGTGKIVNKKYEKYHQFSANGLVMHSAKSYTFKGNNGKVMSIQEYMEEVKGTLISHPDYPCVHIGSHKSTNFVPMELASIIAQAYRGKMEPELTASMIKGAAVGPEKRFEKIEQSNKGSRYESCKVLEEFGVGVSSKITEIADAKLLHPPKIRTSLNRKTTNDTPVDSKEGKWTFKSGPLGDQRTYTNPVTVPKFGVLDLAGVPGPPGPLNEFLNRLSKMGEAHGMKDFIEKRNQVEIISFNRDPAKWRVVTSEEISNKLSEFKKKNVKFVIVVISKDGREYATVKAEAEVQVGILTACIKSNNVIDIKNQTLTNYLLKLNAKLNGGNWEVDRMLEQFFTEPVIIFGADVTHPAPNSKTPSIAAVTASYNLNGMGYSMHIQAQKSKQEIIDRLGNICEKMMREFHSKTGKKPKRLIMFRDGVSEGYFDEIKIREYEQIQEVCDRLSPSDPILITFVVVKKRHHTRFQPINKKDEVGRFGNVRPGTVVDTRIVHPTEQEFFLNSHVGIQGTSKPTRYHVIHDDNKFTMSRLQKLTYYLCYAFVRCTQPVSYPAATYYAHLAAYRARHLIEKEGENTDLAALERMLTIHPDLMKTYPMFFV